MKEKVERAHVSLVAERGQRGVEWEQEKELGAAGGRSKNINGEGFWLAAGTLSLLHSIAGAVTGEFIVRFIYIKAGSSNIENEGRCADQKAIQTPGNPVE